MNGRTREQFLVNRAICHVMRRLSRKLRAVVGSAGGVDALSSIRCASTSETVVESFRS